MSLEGSLEIYYNKTEDPSVPAAGNKKRTQTTKKVKDHEGQSAPKGKRPLRSKGPKG